MSWGSSFSSPAQPSFASPSSSPQYANSPFFNRNTTESCFGFSSSPSTQPTSPFQQYHVQTSPFAQHPQVSTSSPQQVMEPGKFSLRNCSVEELQEMLWNKGCDARSCFDKDAVWLFFFFFFAQY